MLIPTQAEEYKFPPTDTQDHLVASEPTQKKDLPSAKKGDFLSISQIAEKNTHEPLEDSNCSTQGEKTPKEAHDEPILMHVSSQKSTLTRPSELSTDTSLIREYSKTSTCSQKKIISEEK